MTTPPSKGGVDRRTFLGMVVAAAAATACTSSSTTGAARDAGTVGPVTLPRDPFTLGVASGDPLPDSVILWTRLAIDPQHGGGMPVQAVPVTWEIGADKAFTEIVAHGDVVAEPHFAHSLHVDARGLAADTWYSYRFRTGSWTSPIGRTRTTPAAGTMPASGNLRFAFASCQNYPDGYYTGYPHMADERLDLVVWLGDYIYEGAFDLTSSVRGVRAELATTLDDYRNRYALYKGEANLRDAHALCPWVTIWDDHEVSNNYAGPHDDADGPQDQFLARRAAAYQAFYEHQPVRLDPPAGPHFTVYRSVQWGSLAEFVLLDERQYRNNQACAAWNDVGEQCPEVAVADRTMLGADQETWLVERLDHTQSVWTVLANEVVMTPLPLLGTLFNLDQWDGYTAARQHLLDALAARPALNPLVITGDVHMYAAGDVHAVPTDNASPILASEFVGGSITSGFPQQFANAAQAVIEQLPQIHYANVHQHGYATCELTAARAQVEFRTAPVDAPTADITTAARFEVLAGTPGVRVV